MSGSPPHHPQGPLDEKAVRLDQRGPHPSQPHLIHPCPAPVQDPRSNPDGFARNRWTAWTGTCGQLGSEPVEDVVGMRSRQRTGAKQRHLKVRSLEDVGRSAVRAPSRRGSGRTQEDSWWLIAVRRPKFVKDLPHSGRAPHMGLEATKESPVPDNEPFQPKHDGSTAVPVLVTRSRMPTELTRERMRARSRGRQEPDTVCFTGRVRSGHG